MVTVQSSTAAAVGLKFLWLEITGKCNLTCSHCYADSGPSSGVYGDMRFEDWSRAISEAVTLGCRRLQFIGGEPTMHPDLRALIAEARQSGFSSIEVFTNATRLSVELIRCFREYNIEVASSFYTDDPDTHSRITGSRASWQRTVDGFREILAAGLPLRVGVIEMEPNAGQLDQTTRFLASLGVRRVKADGLRGVGRGRLQQLGKTTGEFDELCGQCWKGRLCVTPSGMAYPCVFARAFPMGDVRGGLSAILDSVQLADFRTRLSKSRHQAWSALGCDPYACNPDDQCNPDCTPNYGCSPTFCHPESGSCNPNEPSECGPAK